MTTAEVVLSIVVGVEWLALGGCAMRCRRLQQCIDLTFNMADKNKRDIDGLAAAYRAHSHPTSTGRSGTPSRLKLAVDVPACLNCGLPGSYRRHGYATCDACEAIR